MGGDATGLFLLVMAFVLSFLGLRSPNILLKVLAGIAWVGLGVYWTNNTPASITKGSSTDTIIMVVLYFAGIAFMLSPFFTTRKNGVETGGGFRVNMDRLMSREDRETSKNPDRHSRNSAYEDRIQEALHGRRRTRW